MRFTVVKERVSFPVKNLSADRVILQSKTIKDNNKIRMKISTCKGTFPLEYDFYNLHNTTECTSMKLPRACDVKSMRFLFL